MMTDSENKRALAQRGNQNAAKPADKKRKAISIMLPPDLIEKLRAGGNVTQQIETAIRQHNGW